MVRTARLATAMSRRCISLLDQVLASSLDLNFYLAGIFARIDPFGQGWYPAEKKWQTLMRNAWDEAAKLFPTKLCRGTPSSCDSDKEELARLG